MRNRLRNNRASRAAVISEARLRDSNAAWARQRTMNRQAASPTASRASGS